MPAQHHAFPRFASASPARFAASRAPYTYSRAAPLYVGEGRTCPRLAWRRYAASRRISLVPRAEGRASARPAEFSLPWRQARQFLPRGGAKAGKNVRFLRWHGPCCSTGMATKPIAETGGTPATSAPAQAAPLTINAILSALASRVLTKRAEKGLPPAWAGQEHVEALRLLAMDYGMPEARSKEFRAILAECGMGGNASQFRQWLERPAPKGPGLLPQSAGKLSLYD